LGRLGHESSVLIYGGAALAEVSQERADESITLALASGINHFDTAADYGESELRLGEWMPRIRADIFLATKTGERKSADAAASIRRSLERLRTDRVDLIQLHAVCDPKDLDRATGSGGALEAAIEARDEGLAGGIGITGHGMGAPATHLEALRRFPFDTVLTPFNYRLDRDPQYRRDFEALAEEIRAQGAGLMLIKHLARNLWPSDGGRRFATWYEPFDEQANIDAAVAFALGRAEATGVCTAGDIGLLAPQIEAEKRAAGLTTADIDEVLADIMDYESPFVATPGRALPGWF
jgi:aryl-alcohol dehydrogenase-like predicted oxidoreductase